MARLPNVPMMDLGRRTPNPLAMLRALLINSVRARRIASRARITAQFRLLFGVRCSTGANSRTSARASSASLRASAGSFLASLAVIQFNSRGFGHDDLVPQPLQLAADPGRLRTGFQRDAPWLSTKMFIEGA